MLTEINQDDLIFSNSINDSRINTELILKDYDWMNYVLKTKMRTLNLGVLEVDFSYFGSIISSMKVKQIKDGKVLFFDYTYSSDLFREYIISFLVNHIKSWSSEYAFYGGQDILDFYNEVIKVGNLTIHKTENIQNI